LNKNSFYYKETVRPVNIHNKIDFIIYTMNWRCFVRWYGEIGYFAAPRSAASGGLTATPGHGFNGWFLMIAMKKR
jgi:hypothetical protein